jgi:hypothetical protein
VLGGVIAAGLSVSGALGAGSSVSGVLGAGSSVSGVLGAGSSVSGLLSTGSPGSVLLGNVEPFTREGYESILEAHAFDSETPDSNARVDERSHDVLRFCHGIRDQG